MTKRTVQQLAQDYLLFGEESLSLDEIIQILQVADGLYHNGTESFLSDEQYDTIRRYAQTTSPDHVYFLGVGSEVRGGKINLPHKMGSLTQAYEGDTEKWVKQYNLEKEHIVVGEKLDGTSAQIVYDGNGKLQIAFSRGDGIQGADITRHIRRIPTVPQQVRNPNLRVRGEILMKKANFPAAQELVKSRSGQAYKNARNMTAGLMNAEKNIEAVYQYLDFVAYEILNGADHEGKSNQLDELVIKHGFLVPGWSTYLGKELNDNTLTDQLNTRRAEGVYEIDGLVLEVNKADLRKKITPSRDTLNPEYARKYKIADASNLAITTVKGVEWNVSKDGYLKPRVNVETVELVGVSVQFATGFNAKFIKDNGIGPGAKIKITRSGDVIPFIVGVVKPIKNVVLPDGNWTDTGVDLIVKDLKTNPTVQLEQLKDFFTSIDVPALKEGNLQTLFDKGFTTPESVITLTEAEMCSMLGKAIGKKVFDGLRAKLTNIPLYVLMGAHSALGRGIGVRKMKKLFEAFEGKMTRCENIVDILTVDGFEHKTATKIVNGMPAVTAFLMKINPYVKFAKYEEPKTGGMSGQTIVFTGFRSKELEEMVEAQGGKMGSAVSSKTTILVADSPESGSTKITKAKELGVKVISVDQLKAML